MAIHALSRVLVNTVPASPPVMALVVYVTLGAALIAIVKTLWKVGRRVASKLRTVIDDHADADTDPGTDSDESPQLARLLTPAEAAEATGLSRKQITGRMDRGSLRTVKDESGTRRVPRTELVRAELLQPDESVSHPTESGNEAGGELVIWRDLYERERQERVDAQAHGAELQAQLAAIANAGPIRAARLRKQLRRQLTNT
jgi:hypothetical protein